MIPVEGRFEHTFVRRNPTTLLVVHRSLNTVAIAQLAISSPGDRKAE